MIHILKWHNLFNFFSLVFVLLLFSLPCNLEANAGDETTEKTVDFARDIQPILSQNCVKCHGPDKQEKGLRLDGPVRIQQAVKDGEVIVPGKLQESELYRRISLPPGDYDIMPPVDESEPLAKPQVDLIRRWIADGADVGNWLDLTEETATSDALAQIPPPPPEAVTTLEELGVLVGSLAQNTTLMRVDFSPVADKTTDAHLHLLAPIAEQLRWLNLARTDVSDAGLGILARCHNLTRLHLENSRIGDAGLKHLRNLTNLEYLNLYGTNVGDAGLEELTNLTKLKKIFLWNTKVSPNGIQRLRERLPELDINAGRQGASLIGWSKEQLGAWNTLMTVWGLYDHKDWEKVAPHFHENWVGWFDDFELPVNQSQWREHLETLIKDVDFPIWRITPVALKVVDDVAVIHSTYYRSSVNRTTGKVKIEEGRSIDTLKKDGETWKLIGSASTRFSPSGEIKRP